MTESQALTPAERQRLAEFLGLHELTDQGAHTGLYVTGDNYCTIISFAPDLDGGQCWMVHDALIAKGASVRTAYGRDYSSAVVSDAPAVWIREPYKLRLALCRAALAWLDARKEKP